MVLGRLRSQYEKIMRPLGELISKTGISPNMITLVSVGISVLSCYSFALSDLLFGGIFAILAGVIDMFDGAVARASGKASPYGAVFDHVMDRYAEFFMVFGIGLSIYAETWIGFLCLFSMVMASFTRAKAESVGGLEKCTVGIAERQEKLGILLGSVFLTYLFPTVNILGFTILEMGLLLIAVLSQITVIQRLNYTKTQQTVIS